MIESISSSSKAHLTFAESLQRLESSSGDRSILLYEHGTLRVKLYAPRGHDPQTPHRQDELYVVAQGTGIFWDGETRCPFQPGDLLFAAAGRPHRFEDFTDDFAVWVMFYGQEGGEEA